MQTDLAGAQSHLAATLGTAADAAVVARVADAVSELRLEADMAGGVQLDAGLALLLASLSDPVLQQTHLVLFSPDKQGKHQAREISIHYPMQVDIK